MNEKYSYIYITSVTYIINVFLSVNLTLRMVTTIHNIRKWTKIPRNSEAR